MSIRISWCQRGRCRRSGIEAARAAAACGVCLPVWGKELLVGFEIWGGLKRMWVARLTMIVIEERVWDGDGGQMRWKLMPRREGGKVKSSSYESE